MIILWRQHCISKANASWYLLTNQPVNYFLCHTLHTLFKLFESEVFRWFFFSSRPSELAREQAWVFVCGASVRMSTQAWVFTLEVPISSWRWQESMSWLSSNELLQQNLSATFSLCLTLFFFPPPTLRICPSFPIILFLALFLPAHCLFPLSFYFFFRITHRFHFFAPCASALALSFCVGT